jgi:hypothetical protein
MGRRQVAQPLREDLPGDLKPGKTISGESSAAADVAEPSEAKASSPRVDWLRVTLNVALLLVLVLEIFAVDKVYLSSSKALKILGGLTKAVPALWIVIDMVMSLFKGEREAFIRRLSQSRSFTRALGISAGVAFLPAAPAFWEIAMPPPVLLIVPAQGLFSRVTQADKDNGASYLLSVRRADDKVLIEPDVDVTGAGSLLIARDPGTWLEGEKDLLNKVKAGELSGYLGGIERDSKTPILEAWTKDPRPVRAKLPRQGKLKFELFSLVDGKREAVAVRRETVCRSGTKLQVIFLEEPGVETHEPTCIR